MIWRKYWWETRWWFIAGTGFLILVCVFMANPHLFSARWAELWAEALQHEKTFSESARQALNSYQGYIWALWFSGTWFSGGGLMHKTWALQAGNMGAICHFYTCLAIPAAGRFTFSLPVTRRRVLLSHSMFIFGEVALIMLIPSLLVPLIAQLNGQWVSLKDMFVYWLLTVTGSAVFFCFGHLLAIVFGNWIKAVMIVWALVLVLMWPFPIHKPYSWWNPLDVMTGSTYFYYGEIPWLGLLVSLTLAAVFLFIAVRIFERRDL